MNARLKQAQIKADEHNRRLKEEREKESHTSSFKDTSLVLHTSLLFYTLTKILSYVLDFPGGSAVKNPLDNAGDTGDMG